MDRRSLLLGIGAALAAPAIVRADSLMKLWVPKRDPIMARADLLCETVYWMQGRQFFVYNGGEASVHLSMPTATSEWAVTIDPGERRTFMLPLTA